MSVSELFFARFPALARNLLSALTALALVALSSFSQSYALSVGDIEINSRLGQPLDALVRVNLAPGEALRADCVSIMPPATDAMPAITGVRLSLASQLSTGTIRLSGSQPVREPMSELILRVNCPGVPQLTRTFLVMVDPPASFDTPAQFDAGAAAGQSPARSSGAAFASESPRIDVRPRLSIPNEAIPPASSYVVQPGDVLSVIAARVRGRPEYSVWPIAQEIFNANPRAFDNADPNLLLVGATLRIPNLDKLSLGGTSSSKQRSVTSALSTPARVAQVARPSRPAPTPAPAMQKPAPAVQRATAVGDIAQPLPTMAIARTLGPLSVYRLRLRRSGQLEVAPRAVLDQPPVPEAPPEQPDAAVNTRPVQPASSQREIQVVTKSRFWLWDWLILAAGVLFGALLATFGLRGWVQRQRAQSDIELSRAKRHQERLDESRRQRADTEAPAIVVHEQAPATIAAGPVTAAAEHDAEPDDTALAFDEGLAFDLSSAPTATVSEPQSEAPASIAIDDLSVDGDLNFDVFKAPDEDDLELLAKDYAQSSGDISKLEANPDVDDATAMLDPASLGLNSDGTHIMHSTLDLELPDAQDDDSQPLESPKRPADLDDTQLTQAGLSFDAELLELDYNLTEDPLTNESTVAAASVSDERADKALNTRDDEDYYHLEASSIRHVDNLSFEDEQDDESKILTFRQRGSKTGTDGGSSGHG